MFAELRLRGVHGVCITVLSVRREAGLLIPVSAPPGTLSELPLETVAPQGGA